MCLESLDPKHNETIFLGEKGYEAYNNHGALDLKNEIKS